MQVQRLTQRISQSYLEGIFLFFLEVIPNNPKNEGNISPSVRNIQEL